MRRANVLFWAVLAGAVMMAALAARPRDKPDEPVAAVEFEIVPPVVITAVPTPNEETTLHPQDLVMPEFVAPFTDEEIFLAAQTVWGEARGVHSQMEQAAVVWCFLNRVDAFGGSLGEVVTAEYQFAYDPANLTVDDFGRDLEELVRDVVDRWEREKNGEPDVGRVLPRDFLYFGGEDGHNHFRRVYDSFTGIWDWSLPNPYDS